MKLLEWVGQDPDGRRAFWLIIIMIVALLAIETAFKSLCYYLCVLARGWPDKKHKDDSED